MQWRDTATGSDIRIKTDVARVETTALGLPLYHFRYIDGAQVYEGVMAQDVLQVMPEAVSTMDSGYFGVNYEMLGLEMRTVN